MSEEQVTLDQIGKSDSGKGNTEFKTVRIGPRGLRLPSDWNVRKLDPTDGITNRVTDGSHQSPNQSEDGEYYYATVSDLSSTGIDYHKCGLIDKKQYEKMVSGGCRPHQGEVLFSKDGTVGLTTVFNDDTDVVLLSSIAMIDPVSEHLNADYLSQYLSSEFTEFQIQSLKSGTAIRRIVLADIEKISVPLPSLKEQRKIATILYTVDQAIQATEEIIEQVGTIRTGFVHSLFEIENLTGEHERTPSEKERIESILESRQKVWSKAEKERQQRRNDFDGEIDESKYSPPLNVATQRLPELPEGWIWTSLDTFAAYDIDYRGKTPPYSESGIPVISSGNIQNGEIVFDEEKYVSEETYDDWLDRGVPKEGDLLVTTEAPVGKVALYPKGTYLPTRRIITFRTVGIENRYLQAAIRHPYVQNYLTAQSGGSTVGRILKDHLLKMPIPLPPLKEQQEIANTLKNLDRRVENESEYKSQLQRLKRGLIQDLLSGTVRTADADIDVPDEIAQHG